MGQIKIDPGPSQRRVQRLVDAPVTLSASATNYDYFTFDGWQDMPLGSPDVPSRVEVGLFAIGPTEIYNTSFTLAGYLQTDDLFDDSYDFPVFDGDAGFRVHEMETQDGSLSFGDSLSLSNDAIPIFTMTFDQASFEGIAQRLDLYFPPVSDLKYRLTAQRRASSQPTGTITFSTVNVETITTPLR